MPDTDTVEIYDGARKPIKISTGEWWVCPVMGTYTIKGRPMFLMAKDRVLFSDGYTRIEMDYSNHYCFKAVESTATPTTREVELALAS